VYVCDYDDDEEEEEEDDDGDDDDDDDGRRTSILFGSCGFKFVEICGFL